MKFFHIFTALCAPLAAAEAVSNLIDNAAIYIEALSSTPSQRILLLASISYNPSTLSASIETFHPPELSPADKFLRVGVYEPSTSTWKSSTSLTSVENFQKGYAPTFVLTLDVHGAVIGASVKSGKIDAGQTRDFGPKVRLVRMGKSKAPDLNRPVVLSAEGRLEEPVVEKTMLQKYWWVIAGGVLLLMVGGGGE